MKHTLIPALLALMLASCGGGASAPGELRTLDLEAAIDNPRPFDLSEIATEIEFIPLDDTTPDALIGNIDIMGGSGDRFYLWERGNNRPLKIFDRTGRFLTTRGRFGRGPGEISYIHGFALDPDKDILYMSVKDLRDCIIALDRDGNELARHNVQAVKLAFGRDTLLALTGPTSRLRPDRPMGTKKPFIEVFTSDLRRTDSLGTTEKGVNMIVIQQGDEIFSYIPGPQTFISSNGDRLLVREDLSDTLKVWLDGALRPELLLDHGKYAIPSSAFGFDAAAAPGDSYVVWNLLETDRYIFVDGAGLSDSEPVSFVFDRAEGATGFRSCGPDGAPGLFIGGIPFKPAYTRGNLLVGHIQALSLFDNATSITNPRLKTLATTIKEDSNPIIVIVTLKQ